MIVRGRDQRSRGFIRRLLSGRFFDVIMIEHAAEHGLTTNIFRVGRFFRVFVPKRDEVVDSLMRPLPVVMGLNAARNMTEVMFSQGNNVV
jgi:hypothetical protein